MTAAAISNHDLRCALRRPAADGSGWRAPAPVTAGALLALAERAAEILTGLGHRQAAASLTATGDQRLGEFSPLPRIGNEDECDRICRAARELAGLDGQPLWLTLEDDQRLLAWQPGNAISLMSARVHRDHSSTWLSGVSFDEQVQDAPTDLAAPIPADQPRPAPTAAAPRTAIRDALRGARTGSPGEPAWTDAGARYTVTRSLIPGDWAITDTFSGRVVTLVCEDRWGEVAHARALREARRLNDGAAGEPA